MSSPRGHSNVHAEQTTAWVRSDGNPLRARIPISGGATVYSVKDLPPLALSRDEWLEIGRRMEWIEDDKA
jgi:hypothetical protein